MFHLADGIPKSPANFQKSLVYPPKSRIHYVSIDGYLADGMPKSPVYLQKSPVYLQKSPVYLQKSPVYPQKSPVYPRKISVYLQNSPAYAPKSLIEYVFVYGHLAGSILIYVTCEYIHILTFINVYTCV